MFAFALSRKTASTPIMTLPNEILSEIASYVPARHSQFGYAVEAKSIAALSATSRKMRAIAVPYLFRDIVITSEKQLFALSTINEDLLELIRYAGSGSLRTLDYISNLPSPIVNSTSSWTEIS